MHRHFSYCETPEFIKTQVQEFRAIMTCNTFEALQNKTNGFVSKFLKTLIDMEPRPIFATHWDPSNMNYLSSKFNRPIYSNIMKIKCRSTLVVQVCKQLDVLVKLKEIHILSVGRNFNLVSVKPILQSSMITRVVFNAREMFTWDSYNKFFRFSKDHDSQQMLKKLRIEDSCKHRWYRNVEVDN
ncbi:unnamed protein product [Ambrosiozyma monospora]|uniref:Unnamed protein product n=1 Tax=Ambrosiozyma monospora TaxID=43982 RepID=A0ACB5SVJ7_AMBMO|nr:unnamed protein product [Ambrosiozyma monospora]